MDGCRSDLSLSLCVSQETEASAHPEPISESERRSSSKQLKLLDYNRTSAFWPTLNSNATGSVNNKKSELISYSTQFDTLEKEKPSLKNLNLQKDVFPKEIWNSFMQGENRRERIKNRNQMLKDRKLGKKSEINWNDFDDKEKEVGVSNLIVTSRLVKFISPSSIWKRKGSVIRPLSTSC